MSVPLTLEAIRHGLCEVGLGYNAKDVKSRNREGHGAGRLSIGTGRYWPQLPDEPLVGKWRLDARGADGGQLPGHGGGSERRGLLHSGWTCAHKAHQKEY